MSIFFRRKKFLFSLIVFLLMVLYQRLSPSEQVLGGSAKQTSIGISQEAQVVRVVDGDTIEVLLDNKKEKVRLIGINTPETVDPRKKVECFGKEASNKAKEILIGREVYLEADPTQQNVDRYGRLLRYVFVDGIDFGKLMIEQGFAYEYTYDLPYKYQLEYKKVEKQAKEEKIGLWNTQVCLN